MKVRKVVLCPDDSDHQHTEEHKAKISKKNAANYLRHRDKILAAQALKKKHRTQVARDRRARTGK